MIFLPVIYFERVITQAQVDDDMTHLIELKWHGRIMKPLARRAFKDPQVLIALLLEEPEYHHEIYPRTRVCDSLWLQLCHIVLRPELLSLLGLRGYSPMIRIQIERIRDSVGPIVYKDHDRRNCTRENLHEIAPRIDL